MSSTYTSIHCHLIFSTKNRRALIKKEWRSEFYKYIRGTIKGLGAIPVSVGGVDDHVHILLGLKPTHAISDLVREIKKASSLWASSHHDPSFSWQEGYAIFSVSGYSLKPVVRYIETQEQHHMKKTFIEELKEILKGMEIDYDEKYLL